MRRLARVRGAAQGRRWLRDRDLSFADRGPQLVGRGDRRAGPPDLGRSALDRRHRACAKWTCAEGNVDRPRSPHQARRGRPERPRGARSPLGAPVRGRTTGRPLRARPAEPARQPRRPTHLVPSGPPTGPRGRDHVHSGGRPGRAGAGTRARRGGLRTHGRDTGQRRGGGLRTPGGSPAGRLPAAGSLDALRRTPR